MGRISQESIRKIMDTAVIEEVIGEFVHLKKSGQNLKGLSPFSNEKTPSFMVSPVKQIFKDFSSGKGGNVVSFLMEHEKMTYPEALRWLAKKYNIELDETRSTEEDKQEQSDRESLVILNQFAQRTFTKYLFETDEGKSIGLSYFRERGFNEVTLEKFGLGYSPEEKDKFTKEALDSGYQEKFLLLSGLSKDYNGRKMDFYRGRVIFPIHDFLGKVVAFAGRTLKTEKKIPKYINSPETPVYNKSKILYGAYLAKHSIRQHDECLMVEGYTDVISLFQGGVENVVASSGTALTSDQVKLVKRLTDNITMLYDGDKAGINAALRGVDIILEEGLNVKVVILPEGEDPDSFIRKEGAEHFRQYIAREKKDFVILKTHLLLDEAEGDTAKKAALVHDIVNTIAKIPDPIKRSLYVKECSQLLDIDEQMLFSEINKQMHELRARKRRAREVERQRAERAERADIIERTAGTEQEVLDNIGEIPPQQDVPPPTSEYPELETPLEETVVLQDTHEREVLRIILDYGERTIDDEGQPAAVYIADEIKPEAFRNNHYKEIYQLILKRLDNGDLRFAEYIINSGEEKLAETVVSIISDPHELSTGWEERYQIIVPDKQYNYMQDIENTVDRFKLNSIVHMIRENQVKMKATEDFDEIKKLMQMQKILEEQRRELCEALGEVIVPI